MGRRVLRTSICDAYGLRRDRDNDVTSWTELGPETQGSREKKILLGPRTRRRCLLKFPKYGPFEIVSEIFNCILAHELGIDHVQYVPAVFEGRRGVLCRSFLRRPGEELWEMRDMLCHSFALSSLAKKFGREAEVLQAHNISDVFLALESEFGPKVLPAFFRMVGLDALIGHGDRHWSNYGVVHRFQGDDLLPRFAPVYDTASGYLTEIDDDAKLASMRRNELRDDEWFRVRRRGLCKITVPGDIKCSHFDLMRFVMTNKTLARYKHELAKAFRRFDSRLPRAILRRFFPDLGELRTSVIETILCTRHRIGTLILDELL